jgi:hypothetical protein
MTNLDRFRLWVVDLSFQDWKFVVKQDGSVAYLQVEFAAPCNVTGATCTQTGRKWRLSEYMTHSEFVHTGLKAVLTAIEHEARETFLYKGRAIFGPHFDVDALWEIADEKNDDKRTTAHITKSDQKVDSQDEWRVGE